jgi:hypothetical protein
MRALRFKHLGIGIWSCMLGVGQPLDPILLRCNIVTGSIVCHDAHPAVAATADSFIPSVCIVLLTLLSRVYECKLLYAQ